MEVVPQPLVQPRLVRIAATLREPAVGPLEQLHGIKGRVPLGLVPFPAKLVASLTDTTPGLQIGEALLLPSLTERLVQLLPTSLGPHLSTRLALLQPPVQTVLLLVLLVPLWKPPLRLLPLLALLQAGVPLLLIAYRSTTRLLISTGFLYLPRRLLPLPLLRLRHLPLRGQFREQVRQQKLVFPLCHASAVYATTYHTLNDRLTREPTQTTG